MFVQFMWCINESHRNQMHSKCYELQFDEMHLVRSHDVPHLIGKTNREIQKDSVRCTDWMAAWLCILCWCLCKIHHWFCSHMNGEHDAARIFIFSSSNANAQQLGWVFFWRLPVSSLHFFVHVIVAGAAAMPTGINMMCCSLNSEIKSDLQL